MSPMDFPERFSNLPPYAFPRLRALLEDVVWEGSAIDMTIGSPQHPYPHWVADIVADHSDKFGGYPPNDGTAELRQAISDWVQRRYSVGLNPEHQILPLNGTREGLFNACLTVCPEHKGDKRPAILMPNPFYQVYSVAALAVGAEPIYVPATKETGFLPDFRSLPAEILNRTAIAYICSPSNPQGAVASESYWVDLLQQAETYGFRVFSDECYSEIYRDQAPKGLLTIASRAGIDPEAVLLFNSLSKRSNLAGLRSGFVAGGRETISRMKNLRAYAGAPLTFPLQKVAEKVWMDEDHVKANRALYREKLAAADLLFADIPGFLPPRAGFFLWLPVPDGEAATRKLWAETGVKVLPGAYLGRDVDGVNPGKEYIRVALVAPKAETQLGLEMLRRCLYE